MVTLLVAFCKSCYQLVRVKETDNQVKKRNMKNKPTNQRPFPRQMKNGTAYLKWSGAFASKFNTAEYKQKKLLNC
jgi:hypothetical protein